MKAQEDQFVRLDTLRSMHLGGSVAYSPLNARIRMLVCNLLYCGYGSTEGGTVAYVSGEAVFGMDRAVGIVTPWVEVQVVDDQKKSVEYGKDGEIRIRAVGQGQRYRKSSGHRYELDEADWFYPGDLGVLFQNGLLMINGRVNEIINRGGTKISPDVIDEVLKKCPGIGDAAVVGVLDDVGIEQIWAAVTSSDGAEIDVSKVYDYCRKTASLYIPDRVFQIKEVPRNRLGKVSRETLKEELKKREADLAHTIR
ncbi:MAG: AMP-binding protein [Deltaproteobacteria bacterium]|nr:AMP-binding protein [Deltaproteobacteria bacterium]